MNRKRTAFTLVEILIVVVIMAILAAVIIPQFSTSTEDARSATAAFNLQGLRSQIEVYKLHHGGRPPAQLERLIARTNASGATGAAATTHPFGPYMLRLPENPFNKKSDATLVSVNPTTAPSGSTGWVYNTVNGNVFLNDPQHWTD